MNLIDFILHIDKHLLLLVQEYHTWTYLILFAIVFAETGLVVTPFLPGDSLLFAAGAIIARPESGLSILTMIVILMFAAFCGDITNYQVGRFLGATLLERKRPIINKKYLEQTHSFYEKHGGKTIIYARFVPIVRTFAPFVAGLGKMSFRKYILFGLAGSLIWVSGFLSLGYFFGNIPVVKKNFTLVALSIVFVSVVLPVLLKVFNKGKKE